MKMKILEIMFIAAQVFYDHGQFAEAIKRLEKIFQYDPKHKFAAYAVNTMLDCYVRLRYWDEINQWATKLIDAKNSPRANVMLSGPTFRRYSA